MEKNYLKELMQLALLIRKHEACTAPICDGYHKDTVRHLRRQMVRGAKKANPRAWRRDLRMIDRFVSVGF